MARLKYYNAETGQWEYADKVMVIGGASGVTTAQAESLWALMKKAAFAEVLTDDELTAFKTAWGITEEENEST